MLTAAYGAWPFDLVLLLVPVVQVAAAVRSEGRVRGGRAGAIYLAINAVAAMQLACEVEYFWFIWMTPALLLAYLGLRRAAPPARFAAS
jgi:hypothetical protein